MDEKYLGLEELRGQAEAMLNGESTNIKELKGEELVRLIHELQVHQIELELQNEELRSAHEALQRSRAEYFELFHFAPIGYLVIDSDGVIQRGNLEITRLVQKDLVDILDRHFFTLIAEDSRPDYVRWLKRLVKTGLSQTIEVQLVVDNIPGPFVRLYAASPRPCLHEGERFELDPCFRISVMEINNSERKDLA